MQAVIVVDQLNNKLLLLQCSICKAFPISHDSTGHYFVDLMKLAYPRDGQCWVRAALNPCHASRSGYRHVSLCYC